MIFLLPCDPLDSKKVDYDFQREFNAIVSLGFKVNLYDHDQLVDHNAFISNIDNRNGKHSVILRSWMLKENQYDFLYKSLASRNLYLINTPEQYLNCHYYPNVYDKIKKFSPKSTWFENISNESIIHHRDIMGCDVIIKDYVKSEKYSSDLFMLSKSLSNEEFCSKVNEFKLSRGKLFNRGIVFKEFLDLKKFGEKTNEFRLFVYNKKVISTSQNTELGFGTSPNLDFLNDIIQSIDSNLYTIDIAELDSGEWIILETGDGSVSGLASGQDEFIFYTNFIC